MNLLKLNGSALFKLRGAIIKIASVSGYYLILLYFLMAGTTISAANTSGDCPGKYSGADKKTHSINMINDVSHLYSFFYAWRNDSNFGGRYGYVDRSHNQQMTQNQATISTLDLTNYNLFNLIVDAKHDEPYTKKDVQHLKRFIQKDGGGVFVVLGASGKTIGKNTNSLMSNFGVSFSNEQISKPLHVNDNNVVGNSKSLEKIGAGKKLIVTKPSKWSVLVTDSNGDPALIVRKMGKGFLAVSGFSPFIGQRMKGISVPEGFRFANYDYVQKLFGYITSGKQVADNINVPGKIIPEKEIELETMCIRCTEYSQQYAQNVVRDYNRVYPQLEKFMGVPLHGVTTDKKLTIHLLPVVGSGWSSGREIAIAMYKDTYYGILGHELTHSWVIPHAEPLSNEGIAIWLGSKIRIAMGEKKIGIKDINRRIDGALNDPHFQEWDPVKMNSNAPVREKYSKLLRFGKYMLVLRTFEEKYGEDILAEYFRLKRKIVPEENYKFTCHDSAWLWSEVTGEDQFEYLNSLGISVDSKKVTIK